MTAYKYSLAGDVLTINTGRGQYKFKIENNELLENVDLIAGTVISELKSIGDTQGASREGLSHYARLLLATLNICERYAKLEKKYDQLNQTIEALQQVKSHVEHTDTPISAQGYGHISETIYTPAQHRQSVAQENSFGPQQPPSAGNSCPPSPPADRGDQCSSSTAGRGKTESAYPETVPETSMSKTTTSGGIPVTVRTIAYPPQAAYPVVLSESPGPVSQTRSALHLSPGGKPGSALSSLLPGTSVPVSARPPARATPVRQAVATPKSTVRGKSEVVGKTEPPERTDPTEAFQSINPSAQHHSTSSGKRVLSAGIPAPAARPVPQSPSFLSSTPVLDHPGASIFRSSRAFRAGVLASSSQAALSPSGTGMPPGKPLEPAASACPVEAEGAVEEEKSRGSGQPMGTEKSPPTEKRYSATQSENSKTSPLPLPPTGPDLTPAVSRGGAVAPPAPAVSPAVAPAGASVSFPGNRIRLPDNNNRQPQPAGTIVSGGSEYRIPLLSFLNNTGCASEVDRNRIRSDAELLEKKLGYFGIKGEVMGISPGPVITTYEYRPDPGIKISKIVNLADDLALALSAFSIRIVAPIPGKDVMGIEIPNIKKSLVPFIDLVTSKAFTQSTSKVPICLGKDIIGKPVVVELESMPHLLIAGATGTGKSVGLNAMITSILYKASPDEVRFLMIDPKRIELSFYNDIPHLLTPVITDMNKANIALQWMVREMDRRYNLLAHFQVRHIEQFNQKLAAAETPQYDDNGEQLAPLPYIVVIIDELADLMMTASRDIEFSLTRLAQMARAAGIHLILATQRPSVDVLTGIIKANFPTRISFQVSSKTDSRTIIDSNGAETLLGNGDMLFVPPGTARLTRVHGTFLSEEELLDITTFIKNQRKPEYIFDVIAEQQADEVEGNPMEDEYDEKYNQALEVVQATRQASISGIQRALRVGYNRAARIIDLMEKNGVVGPSDGVKPRKVLVNSSPMG